MKEPRETEEGAQGGQEEGEESEKSQDEAAEVQRVDSCGVATESDPRPAESSEEETVFVGSHCRVLDIDSDQEC